MKKAVGIHEPLPAVPKKLLVKYLVQLDPKTGRVELERGDVVITEDGMEAGIVAAIVLNCHYQEATHFLLGLLPPTAIYRLIPLALIDKIKGKMVWLSITSAALEKLPVHLPDC